MKGLTKLIKADYNFKLTPYVPASCARKLEGSYPSRAWMFLPHPVGKLTIGQSLEYKNIGQSLEFEGICFENIKMNLELNGNTARLSIYAQKPKNGYC